MSRQKLVNLVVPDKSEKFPGSQRNWDMEISIRKVQLGGPLSDSSIPMSQTSDKEKFRLLSEEVQSLLLKRVIEEIPLTQSTPGFYSRLGRGTGNRSSPKGGVSNIQGGNNLFTRPRLLGTFKTSFLVGSCYIIGRSSPQMHGFCQ
jgi:hypothetical protein